MLVCTRPQGHPGKHAFRRTGTVGCPAIKDVEALSPIDTGEWDRVCLGCGAVEVSTPADLCRTCEITQVRIMETRRGPQWGRFGGKFVYVMGGD